MLIKANYYCWQNRDDIYQEDSKSLKGEENKEKDN